MLLALWFHDAVYEPKRSDNEARSAERGAAVLAAAGAAGELIERFRELVMATRHEARPGSADARLLVDIDLAILGAGPERFAEYEAQVRKEYAHVPEFLFRIARSRILEQFLARPAIYSTPRFKDRFEAQARANLLRSLEGSP